MTSRPASSPAPLAIEEAVFFADRLGAAGMNRDALVVNQVHRVLPEVKATTSALEAEARPHLSGLDAGKIVGRVRRAYEDAKVRAEADRIQIDKLKKRVDASLPLLEVPVFDHDVHDLDALEAVGRTLVG